MRLLALLGYYGLAWFLPGAPVPGSRASIALRRLLVRAFVDRCEPDASINAKVYLGRGTGIRLGQGSSLGKGSVLNPGVSIGQRTLIGPECMFITLNHLFDDTTRAIADQGSGPVQEISIGDDVWMGARVIVLPGVTVGNGAVVGAGSVVTKSVDPMTVVAGNPARAIRVRGGSMTVSDAS